MLVMRLRHLRGLADDGKILQYAASERGVLFDGLVFVGCQRSVLADDIVGNTDIAYIMDQSEVLEVEELIAVPAHTLRDLNREPSNVGGVIGGERVLFIYGVGDHHHGFQ